MATGMAAADVIISRAGASTCNELGACGLPSILIPSPNVTNDHQAKNARALSDKGAAILLPEKDCSPEVLMENINIILNDQSLREQMSRSLRRMIRLDSTERICNIVEEIIRK